MQTFAFVVIAAILSCAAAELRRDDVVRLLFFRNFCNKQESPKPNLNKCTQNRYF